MLPGSYCSRTGRERTQRGPHNRGAVAEQNAAGLAESSCGRCHLGQAMLSDGRWRREPQTPFNLLSKVAQPGLQSSRDNVARSLKQN
jgi:hypothetical protein